MANHYEFTKKTMSLNNLAKITDSLKNNGSRIIFTNGCFDVLHKGHIMSLRKSRQLGDYLVVGLNSDNSVRKLKGEDRPVNSENDRAFLLEALDFVDFIVIFDETSPIKVIEELQPDVYTKGGDYDLDNVIGQGLGKNIIENYGGRVELIPLIDGYSSSRIIDSRGGR